jgi:hypothetical protein
VTPPARGPNKSSWGVPLLLLLPLLCSVPPSNKNSRARPLLDVHVPFDASRTSASMCTWFVWLREGIAGPKTHSLLNHAPNAASAVCAVGLRNTNRAVCRRPAITCPTCLRSFTETSRHVRPTLYVIPSSLVMCPGSGIASGRVKPSRHSAPLVVCDVTGAKERLVQSGRRLYPARKRQWPDAGISLGTGGEGNKGPF